MNLLDKQILFAHTLPDFLEWTIKEGYSVTLGEAWRSDETAALYAKEGKGICKSEHRLRLAIDLCLFKGTEYIKDTASYAPMGAHWKRYGDSNLVFAWGGDFGDGNHFSIEHEGVR